MRKRRAGTAHHPRGRSHARPLSLQLTASGSGRSSSSTTTTATTKNKNNNLLHDAHGIGGSNNMHDASYHHINMQHSPTPLFKPPTVTIDNDTTRTHTTTRRQPLAQQSLHLVNTQQQQQQQQQQPKQPPPAQPTKKGKDKRRTPHSPANASNRICGGRGRAVAHRPATHFFDQNHAPPSQTTEQTRRANASALQSPTFDAPPPQQQLQGCLPVPNFHEQDQDDGGHGNAEAAAAAADRAYKDVALTAGSGRTRLMFEDTALFPTHDLALRLPTPKAPSKRSKSKIRRERQQQDQKLQGSNSLKGSATNRMTEGNHPRAEGSSGMAAPPSKRADSSQRSFHEKSNSLGRRGGGNAGRDSQPTFSQTQLVLRPRTDKQILHAPLPPFLQHQSSLDSDMSDTSGAGGGLQPSSNSNQDDDVVFISASSRGGMADNMAAMAGTGTGDTEKGAWPARSSRAALRRMEEQRRNMFHTNGSANGGRSSGMGAGSGGGGVGNTPRRPHHGGFGGSQRASFHPVMRSQQQQLQSQPAAASQAMSQMSDFCTPTDQPVQVRTDMELKEDVLFRHALKKSEAVLGLVGDITDASPLDNMSTLSNGLGAGGTQPEGTGGMMTLTSQSQSQQSQELCAPEEQMNQRSRNQGKRSAPIAPRKHRNGSHFGEDGRKKKKRRHVFANGGYGTGTNGASAAAVKVLSQPLANPFRFVLDSHTQDVIQSELRRQEKQRSKTFLKPATVTDSYFVNNYELVRVVDKGSFGEVLQCMHRLDGCLYAVKRLRRPYTGGTLTKTSMLGEALALAAIAQCNTAVAFPSSLSSGDRAVQKRVTAQKGAGHIVRYFNSWREGATIYIAYEWCAMGSLGAQLAKLVGDTMGHQQSDASSRNHSVLTIAYQMALALTLLHDLDLAHLDVKPDNILEASKGLYKLADFGLVTKMDRSGAGQSVPMEGDKRYLPAEAMCEEIHALDKVDMYSLGVSLYELLSGCPFISSADEFRPPSTGSGENSAIQSGLAWLSIRDSGEIAPIAGATEFLLQLIGALVRRDPERRPSAWEVVAAIEQHRAEIS